MSMAEKIRALLAGRRQGFSLPQGLYLDPEAHEFDRHAIFERHWLQAGLVSQLRRPGDYLTFEAVGTSVIVLRDDRGEIAAFFNTCRHRGARLCRETAGHISRRLVCPYHQWAYDLQGHLAQSPRMHPGFERQGIRLAPARVETVAGVIYVCLGEDAPDFAPFRAALEPMLEPHELIHAKVAHTVTLIERADWKLVMENARECYHCRAGHPELMRSFSDFTAPDVSGRATDWIATYEARCEARGLKSGSVIGPWYEIGRYPLTEGVVSYTMDGRPAVAKTLGRVGDGDVGVMWWALQPNGFNHVAGDYGFFFQAVPTGPLETTVTGTWIVHEDAVEGVDYDLARLSEVWTATNDQDRALSENNQRGVESRAYVPGPYSQTSEQLVLRFADWYCGAAERHLAIPTR
ncbi:MAG TPA: aromatic ring-hydroxylating dioxygenase subunit alpha [Steroidobacteraceae bacterium]|jgi:Rieske 2Fe-2S family protein|nr:aromatic ring-hydroxylating dioxygenase subunit alpha [Steroidobacteraceae bacterium]